MHAHRRQFIIGPQPILARDDWTSHQLDAAGELHLSHCPELPVVVHGSRVLIGDALDTTAGARTPEQQLACSSTDDVLLEHSHGWSGRWLLVLGGRIHMDACGMLGCLYRRDAAAGHTWASSSPALLRLPSLGAMPGASAEPVRHGVGLDFYPAPMSRHDGIQRLLASQVLDLRIEAPAILMPRLLPEPSSAVRAPLDVLDELGERLVQGMRAAARRWPRLWIALTGGYDSRVLVAAARAAGLEQVTCYTQQLPWPSFARADRLLPPLVAAAAGYEHRLLRRWPRATARAQLVDMHTAGTVVGADTGFIEGRQWDPIPLDAGVLRGSCFEVANSVLHRRPEPSEWPTGRPGTAAARHRRGLGPILSAADLLETFDVAGTYPSSLPHVQGLQQWCTWATLHPTSSMDWRDRCYLEQRMGAWAAAVEQQLDVTGTSRVAPFNCHATIAAALALPAGQRLWQWWQADLTEHLAPELARLPYATPDGPMQRAARRTQLELQRLRQAPRPGAHLRQRARRMLERRHPEVVEAHADVVGT